MKEKEEPKHNHLRAWMDANHFRRTWRRALLCTCCIRPSYTTISESAGTSVKKRKNVPPDLECGCQQTVVDSEWVSRQMDLLHSLEAVTRKKKPLSTASLRQEMYKLSIRLPLQTSLLRTICHLI